MQRGMELIPSRHIFILWCRKKAQQLAKNKKQLTGLENKLFGDKHNKLFLSFQSRIATAKYIKSKTGKYHALKECVFVRDVSPSSPELSEPVEEMLGPLILHSTIHLH